MTLAKVKDATLGLKKENCYGTFAELKDRAARLQASEQLLKAYEVGGRQYVSQMLIAICSISLMC